MSNPRWQSAVPEPEPRVSAAGILRAVARGGVILSIISLGLLALVPLRLVERMRHGPARPWTTWVVHKVAWACRCVIGLRVERQGAAASESRLAFVANHMSWLDIFVLNGEAPMVFVAKAEVAGWPVIGWIARAARTEFIARDPRQVGAQSAHLAERLERGRRLLIFPEGTSTDGQQVLPFRASLFRAFTDAAPLTLQPIALSYTAPEGADPRFYGWWGEMPLGPHLLAVLGARRQGKVSVTFCQPIPVTVDSDRKALAKQAENAVRVVV